MNDGNRGNGSAHELDQGDQSAGSGGLARRVEQLTGELARAREELAQHQDQRARFAALERDLEEQRAENRSLILQLKEQAEQIEALQREAPAEPVAAAARPAADLPLEPSLEAAPYTGDSDLPTEVVAQPQEMIEQTLPLAERPSPLQGEQELAGGFAAFDDEDDLEPYGFEENAITREADESMKELVVSTKQVLEQFDQGPTTGVPSIVAPRTLQIPRPELPPLDDPPPRRSPLPWIAVGVAALLAVGVTVFLLTRPGDAQRTSSAADGGLTTAAAARTTSSTPDARPPATGRSRAPTKAAPDAGTASRAPAVATPDAGLAAPDTSPPPPPRRLSRRQRRRHRILLIRATRLIERRKQRRARELLSRALTLRDDWRVRRLLALSHERSGEPAVAAEHLAKGAHHAPAKHKARLLDRRGQILFKLGQKEAACAAFKAALKAQPRKIALRKRHKRRCR